MSVTAEDIRRWIRDTPERNTLLHDVEFSTEDIEACIRLAVAAFNEETILTAYAAETFPFPAALIYGAVAFLYDGASTHQIRNHLSYSTGGVSVDDMNKGPEYSALAAKFQKKFEDATRKIKNQLNLEQGWGSIQSEYSR